MWMIPVLIGPMENELSSAHLTKGVYVSDSDTNANENTIEQVTILMKTKVVSIAMMIRSANL